MSTRNTNRTKKGNDDENKRAQMTRCEQKALEPAMAAGLCFPLIYNLRASEEVCPKHRNVHREIPVAATITTCIGVRSFALIFFRGCIRPAA